jgi:predicted nucleotide-binding protein
MGHAAAKIQEWYHPISPATSRQGSIAKMQFDWDLLKPEQELTEDQKSLVREIGETFLTTGTGIPDHQKKVQLGKNRHLLNGLVQLGIIRSNWNRYYPTFPALYFLSPPLRDSYAGILHLIFKAIKALYESDGPQRFSFQRIEEQLNVLISGSRPVELVQTIRTDVHLQRAAIFLQEFPHFLFVQDSNNPDIPVSEVIATDNIFDYEDLQPAWKQELARRRPSPISPADVPATKGAENLKVTDKPEAIGDKSRRVFVIHGRDERLRTAIFTFLRALGLEPLEWTVAIQLTGKASPYIGEILEAAFNHAQAVAVLLSPDDEARLRADLLQPDDPPIEKILAGQPRPNVLFEAGMAFASHSNQTALVQFGQVRPFSDVAGRHVVKMDNSVQKRQEFALKLRTAGCSVKMEGTDWHTSGDLTPPIQNTQNSPSQIDPGAPRIPKPPRSQAVRLAERISNLVSLKPLSTPRRVLVNESDTWREVGPQEDGLLAAIAIFRNEPIKGASLRSIDGLTAQITFFESNGGEVLRIHNGTWLDDPFNHTSLAVSDTRELLIAVDHPGAPSPFAIENTRRRAADYEHEGSREKPLARGLYDVKVRLIRSAATQGDVIEDFHFNLDLREDAPILKLEWTR